MRHLRQFALTSLAAAAVLTGWRIAVWSQREPATRGPMAMAEPRSGMVASPPAPARPIGATAAKGLPAIAAFDAWADKFVHAPGMLTAAELRHGADLARARRAELKTLIQRDAKAALGHAVAFATRRALPPEVVAQLETPIDAFAEYEVAAICDERGGGLERWVLLGEKRYAVHTFGRRLGALTKTRLPVHGIAIDDQFAMSDQPFRELSTAEALDHSASSAGVSVLVGNETASFPNSAAAISWSDAVALVEQTPNPRASTPGISVAAATADWTTGDKSVLWIRAEFPDDPGSPATDDQILAGMAQSNLLFQEVSHGACSLTTTLLPGTVRLTTTKASYASDPNNYLTLRSDALALARAYDAANGGSGKYNPDTYDRYIVVYRQIATYPWAGKGAVGGKGISLNGTASGAAAAHELGHNQGLQHSHAWAPSAGSAIGEGTHMEYGDAFDAMGSGQWGNFGGHFNTAHKYRLGYLAADSVQSVTASGIYRIYRHDHRNARGVQALKVNSQWQGISYWLEYRHAAPYPNFAAPAAGVPELARMQNGIVVHLDKAPPFGSGAGTYLLDMTPGTTSSVAVPNDYSLVSHLMDDAALAVGETFGDSASGLMATPIRVGGTAPNEWIDVCLTIGTPSGNRAPTVAANAVSTVFTARSDISFQASGSDPDGDTVYFHWDFGDGSIAPAGATVTHRWVKGGTYTVECAAVDGRGGRTATTFPITVTDPLFAWEQRATALTSHYFYDILFDGTKFVAVGSYVAATSADGIHWTLGTGMTSHSYNYAVAHAPGRYVAVGADGGSSTLASIARSADGVSWIDVPVPTGLPQLTSIAYGAGRFVAVGDAGTIVSSTDGANWTQARSPLSSKLYVVRYANGRFMTAGATGAYATSTDGINWADVSLPGEPSTAYALAFYHDQWISITGHTLGTDSAKRVAFVSTDSRTWNKMYLDAPSSMYSLVPVMNSTLLLGVSRSNDGRIFFAEDPFDWSGAAVFPASSASSTTYLRGAAEGNGTLVLVGLSGQIYTPQGIPYLTAQPASQSVMAGQSVAWTVNPYATGPFTYQWSRDGHAIAGATSATLTLPAATTSDAGSYTVAITNANGTTTTTAATLTVNASAPVYAGGWLANLSIRSNAGAGDQTLIVGVSVGGGSAGSRKPLLMRAIGPTLASYGVSSALRDPMLSVFQASTENLLASNDGWRGDADIAAVTDSVGAFQLSRTSADAAIYRLFDPAGYTMQVTGRTGTGIALVEVYDATPLSNFTDATPRLANVSARALVGTGDNVLIAGLVIKGSGTKRLLLRAVGPTLGAFEVGGALTDPKLELYDTRNSKVLENDNWGGVSDIAEAASSVGAFPLGAASKDAALLIELQPGTYSVVAKGVGDTTGVALVEVYELP